MTTVQNAIIELDQQQRLTRVAAERVATTLLDGTSSDDEIRNLLVGLASGSGETCDEIIGFIHAMRQHMVPLSFKQTPLIDLCGTGGSLANRFNVSTCVALVLGQLGFHIAKHGNRGSKRPNGSFDFLESLGINIDLSQEDHQARLDEWGCTFIFARHHHPAVRHVANARKQLTHPSIFNYIGPFCNPASPSIQLIGAASHALADRLFEVAKELDYSSIGIISSDIGLDECSTVGTSRLLIVRNGQTSTQTIDPISLGIRHELSDISVSDSALAEDNARLFKAIIQQQTANHPLIDLICLNAAVVMHVTNESIPISEAILHAKSVFRNGSLQSIISN